MGKGVQSANGEDLAENACLGLDPGIGAEHASCSSSSTIYVKFQVAVTPVTIKASTKLLILNGANQINVPESLSVGGESWVIGDLTPPPPPANPIVASGGLSGYGPFFQSNTARFRLQPDDYRLKVTVQFAHEEKALGTDCTVRQEWQQLLGDLFEVKLDAQRVPVGPGNGAGGN